MRAEGLNLRFGDRVLFEDLSIDFGDRGIFAILGRSGCGKSTLLSILSGNLRPESGRVYLKETDILGLPREKAEEVLRHSFSFLYQSHNLLEDLTVYENCAVSLRIQGVPEHSLRARIEPLLTRLGLDGLKDKRACLLSGGEKARVALARALARQPEVLFSDEPTGSLDKATGRLVMEVLKEESKRRLVILVTHDKSFAKEFADVIYPLDGGAIEGKRLSRIGGQEPRDVKTPRGRWFLPLLKGERLVGKETAVMFFASLVSYLSLAMAVSFHDSSQRIFEVESRNTITYSLGSLTEERMVSLPDSPLSLVQSQRPPRKEAERFVGEGIEVLPDLSYFLPEGSGFKVNGFPKEGASFLPVGDLSLRDGFLPLLKEGEAPEKETFDYLLVNEDMADILPGEPLEARIEVTVSFEMEWEGAVDKVERKHIFRVAGIVQEFPFLGTPRCYYSHEAFVSFLEGIRFPNISEARGEDVSPISLLEVLPKDSPYHSYSWLLYASGEENRRKLEDLCETEGEFSVSSESHEVREGFLSLSESFVTLSWPFLLAEAVATAFIVASLLLAAFLRRRKEAAILRGEGASMRSLLLLYGAPGVLSSFLAGLSTIILSIPLGYLISAILQPSLGISNLVRVPLLSFEGIPLLLPLLLIAVSIFIPCLGAFLPLRASLSSDLSEELREE